MHLSYQSADQQLAALVLNTLLEEYLAYRRTVLLTPTSGALADQRRAFQARLAEEDAAYQNFLSSNQIGDFDADKTSLSQLAASIEQQQLANDAALKEKTGPARGDRRRARRPRAGDRCSTTTPTPPRSPSSPT